VKSSTRLVDVTDTSHIESTPRRFSTSRELRLHTDPGSDLMGLACVQPAAQGGESVITSAISVHEAISQQRPDLLAELYAGFHWHYFGEGRPEDGPITRACVPLWVNNLTVLHARTEFIDHAAPIAPRLLFRLCLQGLEGFRPVDPVLNYFNGGQCGIPLTGQKANYHFCGIYKDPASGGEASLGIPHA
jgi:hypothetical protein